MLTRAKLTTPSRLHFGLLACGPAAPRQFGGVGLMIERPGLEITAERAASWSAAGPRSERALPLARTVAAYWESRDRVIPPLRLTIGRAPAEHVGLGTGTQLSLAVAQLVSLFAGEDWLDAPRLAALTGRGKRSGIGLYGFLHGGLIVDGGRRWETGIPPLLVQTPFPADWSVLVIVPPGIAGLHGADEAEAFAHLPAMSDAVSDRLCRLVLLGLLPAVAEQDLDAFGAALTAIQFHVGRAFAPIQGGLYGRADLEPIISFLRSERLAGAGQSSWGPALYAFAPADPDRAAWVLARLGDRFGLTSAAACWTAASPRGAELTTHDSP